jgi:hypothetical protein
MSEAIDGLNAGRQTDWHQVAVHGDLQEGIVQGNNTVNAWRILGGSDNNPSARDLRVRSSLSVTVALTPSETSSYQPS